MARLTMLLILVLLSTSSFARDWSGFSSVSNLQIYDGTMISFALSDNTIQTDTCQTNNQIFYVDMASLNYPDFTLSMLLAAQTAGMRIRVLPSTGGSCLSGGAMIGSVVYEN